MPLGWAAEALCPQSPLWRFRGHPLQGRALSPSIPLVSLGCCSLGVGVCQSVRRAWQILEDLVGCGGQSSWGLCLTICGGGTEVQPGGGMPFLTSALGHHLEGQHREEGVLGVRLEYTWGSLSAIWALSHLAAGGPAARGKRTQFWKHHLLLPPLCRGGAAMPAAMRFTVLKCAWFLARTTHSLLTATHSAGCSLANTDPKGSPHTQGSWFQLYQASACSEQQAAPRRGSGHASPEGDTLWAGPEGSGQVPPLPLLLLGVLCFWGLGTGCGWAQGLRTSK